MDETNSDLANASTLPLGVDESHVTASSTPNTSASYSASYSKGNITTSSGNASSSTSTSSSSSSAKKHYCPDYFSTQDILSLSQKVPCTFIITLPNCSFIDTAAEGEDIVKGTKLELPLWLARDLHAGGYIEINVPKGYNNTYREILEADANVVNLNKLGPNYYKFGQHLSLMQLDESEDVAKSLVETFHQRYHRLVNFSLSATHDTLSEVMSFESQLDVDEKTIFSRGRESTQQVKNWENRSIERVTANEMVVNMRKRKRAILENEEAMIAHAHHMS